MKKTYLVRFMTTDYQQDFLLVASTSPREASDEVGALNKVAEVLDVWEEAFDATATV